MAGTVTSQEQIEKPNKILTPNHQTTSVGQFPDSQSSSFKKINTDFLSKEREHPPRSSQDLNSSRKSFKDALEKIRLNKPESGKDFKSQNNNFYTRL